MKCLRHHKRTTTPALMTQISMTWNFICETPLPLCLKLQDVTEASPYFPKLWRASLSIANILEFTTNHIWCIHYIAGIFSSVVVFKDFEFTSSFVYDSCIYFKSINGQNRPTRVLFYNYTEITTIVIWFKCALVPANAEWNSLHYLSYQQQRLAAVSW